MAKYTNQIQVNVSDTLRDKISVKAEDMGISVPEYVRYAILNELDGCDEIDLQLLKDLPEALDDIKNGRVIEAKNVQEALSILDDIDSKDND